jgi:hypothetical protein
MAALTAAFPSQGAQAFSLAYLRGETHAMDLDVIEAETDAAASR